jgi:hypothetical protein
MNTTKYKPNLAAQMNEHEQVKWEGKWRNLWLFSNHTCVGTQVHDSERAARAGVVACKINARDNHAKHPERKCEIADGTVMEYSVYLSSIVIQIPVGA